jgi:hypothetical protein
VRAKRTGVGRAESDSKVAHSMAESGVATLHEGDDRRAPAVSDCGRGRRRSGGLATAMGQKAELGRLVGRCAAL